MKPIGVPDRLRRGWQDRLGVERTYLPCGQYCGHAEATNPSAEADKLGHLPRCQQRQRSSTRQVMQARPITPSSAMGRRCACSANAHRACPISSGLIFGSRPPMRSRDKLGRRERKPLRYCGSTPGSRFKATNVLSSSRTPRIPSTVLMDCARRGCRRFERRRL